jgi:Holliday junction resolvase-like predicted endonuclease
MSVKIQKTECKVSVYKAMDNITSGIIGEGRAVTFLRGKGYRILAQNWRTALGELDIIAEDGAALVFF